MKATKPKASMEALAKAIAAEHVLPLQVAEFIARCAADAIQQCECSWKLTDKDRQAIMDMYLDAFGLGRRTLTYGRN